MICTPLSFLLCFLLFFLYLHIPVHCPLKQSFLVLCITTIRRDKHKQSGLCTSTIYKLSILILYGIYSLVRVLCINRTRRRIASPPCEWAEFDFQMRDNDAFPINLCRLQRYILNVCSPRAVRLNGWLDSSTAKLDCEQPPPCPWVYRRVLKWAIENAAGSNASRPG